MIALLAEFADLWRFSCGTQTWTDMTKSWSTKPIVRHGHPIAHMHRDGEDFLWVFSGYSHSSDPAWGSDGWGHDLWRYSMTNETWTDMTVALTGGITAQQLS